MEECNVLIITEPKDETNNVNLVCIEELDGNKDCYEDTVDVMPACLTVHLFNTKDENSEDFFF